MKTLKVPDDIHKALRVRASAIGQPVQELVERILRKAVSGEKPLERLDEVLNVLRTPKPLK
jgi:plasmid stability protein